MREIAFAVQGSAPEPYTTTFMKEGQNITARCTCQGGRFGKWCKHRLRILQGSVQGIVSKNKDEVSVVQSWLPGTDVEKALKEHVKAEQALDAARKRFGVAKRMLESLMH